MQNKREECSKEQFNLRVKSVNQLLDRHRAEDIRMGRGGNDRPTAEH